MALSVDLFTDLAFSLAMNSSCDELEPAPLSKSILWIALLVQAAPLRIPTTILIFLIKTHIRQSAYTEEMMRIIRLGQTTCDCTAAVPLLRLRRLVVDEI